jgi:hypothetical protein
MEAMILTENSAKPTHHPTPMARFGLNPHGAPMWRIVFADSVRNLVGGRWPDGKEEYRLARFYNGPGAKGKWVLESWISALEHTGCTADEYRIKFQAPNCVTTIQHEPYPYDGTYVQRYIFPGEPEGIEELIQKWSHDKNITFAERRRLRQETIDYQAQKTRERELYRLREAQPDPNGLMMLSKVKSAKVGRAEDHKLPPMGLSQLQGA